MTLIMRNLGAAAASAIALGACASNSQPAPSQQDPSLAVAVVALENPLDACEEQAATCTQQAADPAGIAACGEQRLQCLADAAEMVPPIADGVTNCRDTLRDCLAQSGDPNACQADYETCVGSIDPVASDATAATDADEDSEAPAEEGVDEVAPDDAVVDTSDETATGDDSSEDVAEGTTAEPVEGGVLEDTDDETADEAGTGETTTDEEAADDTTNDEEETNDEESEPVDEVPDQPALGGGLTGGLPGGPMGGLLDGPPEPPGGDPLRDLRERIEMLLGIAPVAPPPIDPATDTDASVPTAEEPEPNADPEFGPPGAFSPPGFECRSQLRECAIQPDADLRQCGADARSCVREALGMP